MTGKCVHCGGETTPAYRKPNPKYCSKACIRKAYSARYPERDKLAKEKWVKNNPEKRKAASEQYRKKNSEYYRQYASLRARYVLHAKPKWVDEEKLLAFYKLATELGLEVDHIIPIKHDLVCGLHVPWNLQLLTRSENAQKSNKFDADNGLAHFNKETVDV